MPTANGDYRVTVFNAEDIANPPPANATVFIGSSSIELWTTIKTDLYPARIIPRGISGTVIADTIYYLQDTVFDYSPKVVFIYAGENDIAGGQTPASTATEMESLCDAIWVELPLAKIVLMSAKPSPLRWANQADFLTYNGLIETYAGTDSRLTYVDVSTSLLLAGAPNDDYYIGDELHLSPQGYAVWTAILQPLAVQLEGSESNSFASLALGEMRRIGYTGTYMTSYAPNDAGPTGRIINTQSSQYTRANLSMGRYPSPTAFTTTNPDYSEVSWVSAAVRSMPRWPRIVFWNQIYCADPWGINHIAGSWINNTRVMIWGAEVHIKSLSTGLWTRYQQTDTFDGVAVSPNFSNYSQGNKDIRTETTGYTSVRLVYDASEPSGAGYWTYHGYCTPQWIDPADVADVMVVCRASLVVHDEGRDDDRSFAKFLVAIGADYYPETTLSVYPGVGTSRHRLVTAKWPSYQIHVMHTMTEAQFGATNGFPPSLAGLTEGADPADPDPVPDLPPTPALSNWSALVSNGEASWSALSASVTPYTSGGFPPPLR